MFVLLLVLFIGDAASGDGSGARRANDAFPVSVESSQETGSRQDAAFSFARRRRCHLFHDLVGADAASASVSIQGRSLKNPSDSHHDQSVYQR